jgi:hypothetical protein
VTANEEFDNLIGDADLPSYVVYDARPVVKRQLAWDMLCHDDVPLFLQRIGMTPPAPEGARIEHADAHKRMIPLAQIQDHLRPVLSLATEVICGAMLESQGEQACRCFSSENVGEIVRASVIGVLSHLFNEEVVQVNDGQN